MLGNNGSSLLFCLFGELNFDFFLFFFILDENYYNRYKLLRNRYPLFLVFYSNTSGLNVYFSYHCSWQCVTLECVASIVLMYVDIAINPIAATLTELVEMDVKLVIRVVCAKIVRRFKKYPGIL